MISASIKAIMTNTMTARIVIASALIHPQSKKCFTSSSQTISIAMMASQPVR